MIRPNLRRAAIHWDTTKRSTIRLESVRTQDSKKNACSGLSPLKRQTLALKTTPTRRIRPWCVWLLLQP